MTSNYDKSPMYDNPHPNTFDPMNSSGYNLSPAPPSYNNANSAGTYRHMKLIFVSLGRETKMTVGLVHVVEAVSVRNAAEI